MTSLHATLRDALAEADLAPIPGSHPPPDRNLWRTRVCEAAVVAWLAEDAQVEAAARAIADANWADAPSMARAALGALTHHEEMTP